MHQVDYVELDRDHDVSASYTTTNTTKLEIELRDELGEEDLVIVHWDSECSMFPAGHRVERTNKVVQISGCTFRSCVHCDQLRNDDEVPL